MNYFQRAICSEGSWPWFVHNFLPVHWWLTVVKSELQLLVTWQVSVVGIVNVFGNSENKWIIKLIKLVMGEFDVVFNAITILIKNSSLPGFSGLASLQEFEILWALNVVYQEREVRSDGRSHLNIFSVAIVDIEWFSISCQLLDIEFDVRLVSKFFVERVGSLVASRELSSACWSTWHWEFTSSSMSGELTVVGIVHIFNSTTEDLLSKSIELTLSLSLVIFNTISILIDDVSLDLGILNFFIVLVLAGILDSYHSDVRVRVDERLAEASLFVRDDDGRGHREEGSDSNGT